VRVALAELVGDVDVVFSGINAGANLGVDLMVSGTFAAAREAALHDIAAMAVSHYRRPDVPKTWDHTADWLGPTLATFRQHLRSRRRNKEIWNVNLPAIDPNGCVPDAEFCEVDASPISRVAKRDGRSVRFESDFHARPREFGKDVDRCFSGKLTISRLSPLLGEPAAGAGK
jgi:5'-nucleotidase